MRRAAALIPCAAVLVVLGPMSPALAHGAEPDVAADTAWRVAVAAPLLLAGWAYFYGLRRAWRRAGWGRGIRPLEAFSFGAGLLVLASMLAVPLHAWGRLRFAPHMLEHELLTVIAAPLLAAGRPGVPYLLALPLSWRRRLSGWLANGGPWGIWRRLTHPATAWALHGAALWLWHAPVLFEAALSSEVVHYLQHLTLLGTALLFWASLLPRRATNRVRIIGVFSLFTTTIQTTLLGALLTLSPRIWYPSYGDPTPGGLSPLEDQQLAGLIMWVPAGMVYVAAGLALLGLLLRYEGPEPARRRRDALGAPG
jgi:cytochrome c oxidase assembly factor CtaG